MLNIQVFSVIHQISLMFENNMLSGGGGVQLV